MKSISLSEGKHRIKVVNPGFADYVTNVEVTKQKSLTIQYDFLSSHE
jgi:hypothetical protein